MFPQIFKGIYIFRIFINKKKHSASKQLTKLTSQRDFTTILIIHYTQKKTIVNKQRYNLT